MVNLFNAKSFLLLSEIAVATSMYFGGRAINNQIDRVFHGKPMGWLVGFYSRNAFVSCLIVAIILILIYFHSSKIKNDNLFISCSLGVLLFYISGFITATSLALFTMHGPLTPLMR